MKYLAKLLLFSFFNHGMLNAQPELHKALSYNIRYDGHSDLAPDWSQRKAPILFAAAVFALLFFLKAKNKYLHFALVGLSVVFLCSDYLMTPNNDKSFTLILLLVLFGNFYRNFRNAA